MADLSTFFGSHTANRAGQHDEQQFAVMVGERQCDRCADERIKHNEKLAVRSAVCQEQVGLIVAQRGEQSPDKTERLIEPI